MGNGLGGMTQMKNVRNEPECTPLTKDKITFDPHEGFEYERKERKKLYTEQEADAAGVSPGKRNYCAHLLIPYLKCRAEQWPMMMNCVHEKHAYAHCEQADQELRIREWERERRMRLRAKRLAQKEVEAE